MKKHFLNALVAVVLLATLNACSKDDDVQPKNGDKQKKSENGDYPTYHPQDPNGFGYYILPNGAYNFYQDSVIVYFEAQIPEYLSFKPLRLDKYKNGELLDSVCNQDLAVRFESKARKSHNKEVKWGVKPKVADEFAPVVTLTMGNTMTIKLSKMVMAFGYEYNSLFKDGEYSVTTRFRNSKLNKVIKPTFTNYIRQTSISSPDLGMTSGAMVVARESQTPFDEITITFGTGFKAPTLNPPYQISFGGFRYKPAK